MQREKEELLRELIDKYAKLYMQYAHNNGVPYDDAEDVVMEAFWSFYRSRYFGTLGEQETKAMLARIVKNKCIDLYRKNGHVDEVGMDESKGELERHSQTARNDPINKIVGNEKQRLIYECMNEMKDIYRDPAIMYFVEGRTYEEISSALEISEETCRARISRARKYLKRRLKDIWGPD